MQAPGVADSKTYLAEFARLARIDWPANRTLNVVCHGHSVHAVINVIVTAIGGETSEKGAVRFAADVLPHRPDVVTIDYALNDRGDGLPRARRAWTTMIAQALAAGVPVLLLTPTPDQAASLTDPADVLVQHAEQVRALAAEFGVGLVDSFAVFGERVRAGTPLAELMSSGNHPNLAGHALVTAEVLKWFL